MPWIGGLILVLQVIIVIAVPDPNWAALVFGFAIALYLLYCGFLFDEIFDGFIGKTNAFSTSSRLISASMVSTS
jgi:hypothetical protein